MSITNVFEMDASPTEVVVLEKSFNFMSETYPHILEQYWNAFPHKKHERRLGDIAHLFDYIYFGFPDVFSQWHQKVLLPLSEKPK